MEIVDEINREIAKKELGVLNTTPAQKPTWRFVQDVINFSDSLHKARVETLDELKNILVIPWDDWALSYRVERRFEPRNMLFSMRLNDVALNYDDLKEQVIEEDIRLRQSLSSSGKWTDRYTHAENIEHSKEKILRDNGYRRSDWDALILRDSGNFYLIDGHHRFIAFMDLINNGRVGFNPMKCVLSEFTNLEGFIENRPMGYSIAGNTLTQNRIRYNLVRSWERR